MSKTMTQDAIEHDRGRTAPTDKASVAALDDLTAGNAFRDTLVPRADAKWEGSPMWCGWAIMEAFLAGAKYARDLSPTQGDGMRDALVSAREFLREEHRGLGLCGDPDCAHKRLIKDINAALASHPDRQPGMTGETLRVEMAKQMRSDYLAKNRVNLTTWEDAGDHIRDMWLFHADSAIAAIKRTSQGQP